MYKKAVTVLINLYIKFVSPIFVAIFGNGCRYHPSCSIYTREAVERFGIVKGLKLAVLRILRCHPFSKVSYDPVPLKL